MISARFELAFKWFHMIETTKLEKYLPCLFRYWMRIVVDMMKAIDWNPFFNEICILLPEIRNQLTWLSFDNWFLTSGSNRLTRNCLCFSCSSRTRSSNCEFVVWNKLTKHHSNTCTNSSVTFGIRKGKKSNLFIQRNKHFPRVMQQISI